MQNVEATVISQFGNSPILLQLINNMNAYIDPSVNINNFYSWIWNVDTAVGVGLDIWGRIVGVGRVLEIATVNWFGFTTPDGTEQSGLPFRQAPFYHGTPTTSNFALLDDPYRALILAKALANICNATIPAINQILINLFGPGGELEIPGNSYVTDSGNMKMTYTFGSALDPVSLAIVFQSGVLPTPAGVLATVVQL
jgi:hypothetical protein